MALIKVPELKRKFALLRACSERTTWPLLAVPFGVSDKTLQFWCDGAIKRDGDQMPARAFPILLALVADILPGSRADADVRDLVLGSFVRLEEAVRSDIADSFAALIEREGQSGTALLIRKTEATSLIEPEDEQVGTDTAQLRLGELFRIEFPLRPGCRFAVALQGVQQLWAPVPFAIPEADRRSAYIPGLGDAGTPRFMRERRDAGLHRFVCLQAAAAFPVTIEHYQRGDGAFDKHGLDALSRFYESQPATRRACHVLLVEMASDQEP